MVSAHPSPNQREIVKIAHGWIPLLSPAFQCLSASRILHGRMWIPLFMNHVDLIRPARIHLFILPTAFRSGLAPNVTPLRPKIAHSVSRQRTANRTQRGYIVST